MAGNKNEAKIRFKAETADFTQGINKANSEMSSLRAEMKLNEAQFKNTGNEAEYLKQKNKLLEEQLSANAEKQEALTQKLTAAKEIFGADSEEAAKLARQLTYAKTNEEKLKTEINALNTELDENEQNLKESGDAAKTAGDGYSVLKDTVSDLLADGVEKVSEELGELATDSSSAYAQFAAATGTATDAMGDYEQAIQNVYQNNFGDSLEDVAEKMAKVKEITGEVDPSKLGDLTEKAITMEDTFGMDMTETLRGVNNLMTHFGMSSEEAFDLMAAGAQNGLNYSDELGDNVAEYSGKFAEAGYSADEYFQLLQNGSQGGAYNLDKVNDAVNEVTTKLADGSIEENLSSFSQKTQDTFKSWQEGGASQKDVIDSIVGDIKSTTNEQEKMNLAALAFGTMAEDGGTKFIESLSSTGSAFDDTKGKMEELKNVKYDDLSSSIGGLGRTIKGEILQPVVDEIAPKLSDAINKVSQVIQQSPAAQAAIVGIGVALGILAAALGISSLIAGVQKAFALLNTTMLLNPIFLIVTALTALVAGLVFAYNHSEKFRKIVNQAFATIKKTITSAMPVIKKTIQTAFKAIVKFFQNTWNTAKNIVTTVWNAIKTAITTVLNAIKTVITVVFNVIKTVITTYVNAIKTVIIAVWTAIKVSVTTIVNAIKSTISVVFNAIKALISSIWNAIKSTTSSVWNAIKAAITTAINTAKSVVSSTVNSIKSTVSSVFNAVRSTVSTVWNAIKTAIITPVRSAKSTVSSVFHSIKSTVSSIISGIKSTVSTTFNNIKSAMTKPIETAKSTISGIMKKIKGIFPLKIGKIFSGLKLPHISVNGGKAPFGIGGKGSLPSFHVKWYAKGAVFDKPTVVPTISGFKGFGDAGPEAAAPISVLQDYIASAVEQHVPQIDYDLLGEKVAIACAKMNITMEVNHREFGRVVRGIV